MLCNPQAGLRSVWGTRIRRRFPVPLSRGAKVAEWSGGRVMFPRAGAYMQARRSCLGREWHGRPRADWPARLLPTDLGLAMCSHSQLPSQVQVQVRSASPFYGTHSLYYGPAPKSQGSDGTLWEKKLPELAMPSPAQARDTRLRQCVVVVTWKLVSTIPSAMAKTLTTGPAMLNKRLCNAAATGPLSSHVLRSRRCWFSQARRQGGRWVVQNGANPHNLRRNT
ncbi:hypothetical protein B0T24DRAFT_274381 [Lasiosphaeria ovina]|uniref:Uncharacterized protein n=1 Tax=Lasiosphaeria ovina TaxID=92902 RepID=A0AAE0KCR6_9PEZI|nr:hypothetical protein B0T24DRAFT_274381 [Lasiosphaeria ovina]